eukprot:scaffold2576_cov175-Amphora_coffeaeformis.AAC.11
MTSITTMTPEANPGIQMLKDLASASNEAASDIDRGLHFEAFRAIRSAASHASSLTQLIKECGESVDEYHQHSLNQVTVDPLYSINAWSVGEDLDGYVFSCPFKTTLNEDLDLTKVNLRFTKTISAVAIFNMSLACHLQCCITKNMKKAEVLSNRSCSLYTQAARLLEDCSIQPNEPLLNVYLATCSNIIELMMARGCLDGVRHWKNVFDSTLEMIPENCNSPLFQYFKTLQVVYTGSFISAQAA